jgi:hypothetical protein
MKVCEKHDVPLHGTMDDYAGNEYNSAVTFSCNEGYLLVGKKTSTCGDAGKWSSEPPICEKKCEINCQIVLFNCFTIVEV